MRIIRGTVPLEGKRDDALRDALIARDIRSKMEPGEKVRTIARYYAPDYSSARYDADVMSVEERLAVVG